MKKSLLLFVITLFILRLSSFATVYYWDGVNAFNSTTSWWTARNGTGSNPGGFTGADVFIVQGTGSTTNGVGVGASNQTMTVNAAWTMGATTKLEIEGGATLTTTSLISSLGTFIVNNGGTYNHNATGSGTNGASTDFPGSTGTGRVFGATSNVNILTWGVAGGTSPAVLPTITSPGWGNLTLNYTGPAGSVQMAGALTAIQGNFVVTATGNSATREFRLSASTGYTLSIGGSLTVNGGYLNLISGAGTVTLNVAGDINVSSGTFVVGGNSSSVATINVNGSVSGTTGSLNLSGGLISALSTAQHTLNLTGDMLVSGGTYNMCTSGAAGPLCNINVNGTSAGTTGKIALSGSGSITQASSSGLVITTKGDITLTGTSNFQLTSSVAGTSGRAQILNIGGSLNVGSGTTFTASSTSSTTSSLNFTGAANPSVTFTNAGTCTIQQRNVTIASGKTVYLNNNFNYTYASTGTFTVSGILDCQIANVTGTTAFTLASGATLMIGSTAGITSTAGTGSIQSTGTRTFSTSANYEYNGTGGAQVTGNQLPATVNNLTINNSNHVTLTNAVTVSGTLGFSSGTLKLGALNVTANTFSGVGAFGSTGTGFVVTDGSGGLIRTNIGSGGTTGNVLFPVGATASSYNPVQLDNTSGTADNFTVNVATGSVPGVTSADAVNRTWTIAEATVGGSSATVSLQWNTADENGSFDRTKAGVVRTDGSTVVNNPTYGASSGSNPYTRQSTETNISDFTTYWGAAKKSATITVSPTSLDLGTVVTGSSSAEQTYYVKGEGLTANLVITAPSGYQISTTSGSGFGSSITLTPSGGTVDSTTIYVIFSPSSATGTVTGNITNASTGATTKNVALTGISIAASPGTTQPTLSCGTSTPYTIPVTYNGGSGTNKIIFASASPIVAVPVDGTSYTANAAFGSGSTIAAGVYCVFNGTGNSTVTVTNLSVNTMYYFATFTYNVGTNNSENYYTTSPGTCNTATLDGTMSTDYFRSNVASGNWSSVSSWESSHDNATWITATLAPDYNSTAITIRDNNIITLNVDTTVDDLTISSLGTLIYPDGVLMTINNGAAANDLIVNGTLEYRKLVLPNNVAGFVFKGTPSGAAYVTGTMKINGYNGNGQLAFPNFTFVSSSTLHLLTDARLPTSFNGSVIYEVTGITGASSFVQASPAATSILGNLTIKSTGTGSINNGSGGVARTLNVSGNFYLEGGNYFVSAGNATTAQALNVGGSAFINAGKLVATSNNGGTGTTVGAGTITVTGAMTIAGGTVTAVEAGSVAIGTVNANSGVSLSSGSIVVANGAVTTTASMNVTGSVTQTGGTIYVNTGANTGGSGTLTISGNLNISGTSSVCYGASAVGTNTTSPAGRINLGGNLNQTDGTFGNGVGIAAGSLSFTGTTAHTMVVNGTVTGNMVITVAGSGAVTLNSNMTGFNGFLRVTSGDFTIQYPYVLEVTNGSSPVIVSAGMTMNINGTFRHSATGASAPITFAGATLNIGSNATYQNNINGGTIPTPTSGWPSSSLLLITGTTTTAPVAASMQQTFGNVTWNCSGQSQNIGLGNPHGMVVQGDMTFNNTNGFTTRWASISGTTPASYTINGNLIISSNAKMGITNATSPIACIDATVTVNGNVTVNGTLEVGASSAPAGTFTGGVATLSVLGDLTANTGSIITENTTAVGNIIRFDKNGTQTITCNGVTFTNDINYLVKSTSVTQLAASSSSSLVVNGGANIEIEPSGIFNINGNTLTINGTISNTGTISGTSGSDLNIGGTAGGSVGTLYFTSGARDLNNFTINRTGTTPSVNLGSDIRVHGTASFTSGEVVINSNTLRFNNGSWGSGTVTGSANSNITVDGTGGTLRFTGGNGLLKDMLLNTNATAAVHASEKLDITAGSTPGSVTVGSGAVLTTNDKLSLLSDQNGTSRVGKSSGSITGKVLVERYMWIGTTASNRRWHLLTVPFKNDGNAQTINQAWQEGVYNTNKATPVDPNPGYGTTITKSTANNGAVDGYDQGSTANPSIYYLNPGGTASYAVPTNTNIDITSHEGYMLFIRGDRSIVVGGTGVPAKPTNLRAKGALQIGDVTKTLVPGTNFIGNPYASAIVLDDVEIGGVKFKDYGFTYMYWDPKTSGSNQVGKFIAITSDGVGTPSYTLTVNSSGLDTTIQSGAAFCYVHPGGSNTTIKFQEADKIDQSSNVGLASRPSQRPSYVPNLSKLYTTMYTKLGPDNYSVADGVANTFYPSYNNDVDNEDAQKFSSFNTKEDLSLKRDGKRLAIEKRRPVQAKDTLYLEIKNLDVSKQYQFRFSPQNFNIGLEAYLEDTYTGTSQPISLVAESRFDFTLSSSNAASANPDRFRIVFRNVAASPLPVRFTEVKAAEENKNVAVEWQTANEVNVKQFEVEKSADGVSFTKATTTTANGSTASYKWVDVNPVKGVNYYRIISVSTTGENVYSRIVKVTIGANGATSIVAVPTIVKDGNFGLQFNNAAPGKYQIRVTNTVGQVVYTKQLNYAGGSATQSFSIENTSVKGIYQLDIVQPNNDKTSVKVVVQ